MLNTLQTRNKCYSDIIYQRNKVKEKPINNSNSNNDEPSVKKPRGRPRKNIISTDSNNSINNVELKKRGRPKKLNAITVDSSSQNDNSSSSNLEIDESEEPKIPSSVDDAFNNNINEHGKTTSLSSKMKNLSNKFWKLFKNECKSKNGDINKYQYPTKHQIQPTNEEKKGDLPAKEKNFFLQIEDLEIELKLLSKQFQDENENLYNDEIELMLTKISEKRNENKQSKLKKTDTNKESIPDEGKENIQCTLKKNETETEIEINNIHFDGEKCIGIWLNNTNNSNTVCPTITFKMNDSCKSINCTNVDNFKKESTSKDSIEDNFKTLTADKTPNFTNSVNNHLNDLGLNYIYNPILNCRHCSKNFTSIAEWKLHRSEHLVKLNKNFLCKIHNIIVELD